MKAYKGKALNIKRVGNIPEKNNVIGPFQNGYGLITTPLPLINSFEWRIKFKANELNRHQGIFGNSTNIRTPQLTIEDSDSKIHFVIPTSSNTWGTTIPYTIETNKDYWIKCGWTGTKVYMYVSTDGNSYSSVGEYDQNVCYWTTPIAIGIDDNTSRYFNGTVDLNECSIYINDSLWWNGLTNTVRKYYKYSNINCTATGSPIIIDDQVSGFSSSNYLKTIPSSIPFHTADNWEVCFKFTCINLQDSVRQTFLCQPVSYPSQMLIGEHKDLTLLINTSGNGTYAVQLPSDDNILEEGKTYYVKYGFTGTAYYLTYSIDGNNWIKTYTAESTTKLTNRGDWTIGVHLQSGYYDPFLGPIYLGESYIKINGQYYWKGADVEEYTNSTPNIVTTGSPTITNNIISNFSTTNYAKLPYEFSPKSNDFEFVIKFKTPETYPITNMVIFNSQVGLTSSTRFGIILLLNQSGYLIINLPNADGNNWYTDTYGGSFAHSPSLTTSTWYYGKLKRVGDILSFYYSTNGETWNTIFNSFQLQENFVFPELTQPLIGIRNNGSYYEPFTNNGQIDLSESYIKINNNYIWKGIRGYDFYKDVNVNSYKIISTITEYDVSTKTFRAGASLQEWTVPSGITKLHVDCVASRGRNGKAGGGYGGRVECDLTVTSGQTLYFVVGNIPLENSSYYNASDIRTNNSGITNTTSLNSRLIVAGGGGSGGDADRNYFSNGGNGGGLTGENGVSGRNASGGRGGTQTAGGAGSSGGSNAGGSAGQLGLGGNGGNGGGVGGAGYYGGGGGGTDGHNSQYWRSGGGGGSSYTDSTLCSNVVHTQGYNNDEGYITITANGSWKEYTTNYKAFKE